MPVSLVAFALLAAGCDTTADTTTTTVAPPVTTAAPETTATTEQPQVEGFTYNVGMIPDILRPNYWAINGPDGTITMCNLFCPTKPALFRIMYPGIVVAPDAAAGLPVDAVQEGEVWTVTQPIRDDYTWSDGSLLTTDDIVFTFETVRDAGLGATWLAKYPHTEGASPRLLDVEAIDDFIVRYTFDAEPGAAVWPHQVGLAPIMPRAPWEAVVAAALDSDDENRSGATESGLRTIVMSAIAHETRTERAFGDSTG
jgi:ABC-type transport system substrate-binding protein